MKDNMIVIIVCVAIGYFLVAGVVEDRVKLEARQPAPFASADAIKWQWEYAGCEISMEDLNKDPCEEFWRWSVSYIARSSRSADGYCGTFNAAFDSAIACADRLAREGGE